VTSSLNFTILLVQSLM